MGFSISTGKKPKEPQRVVVYGVEGIGKSTFASRFPDPLFIDTEGSTSHLDVARFDPAPKSWQELLDMVFWARGNASRGSTLVVDTLDWAERLCEDAVCDRNGWKTISQPDYGKGYKALKSEFAKLLDALTEVARAGVNVVCTAHAKISKFELPDEAGAYDRWSLKLVDTPNTSVAAMVKEWADALLFANYKTVVETDSSGKAKARGNKRVLYTDHDATYDAKNRWGLPPSVPFDFAEIAGHIPSPSDFEQPQPAVAPQMQPQQLHPVAMPVVQVAKTVQPQPAAPRQDAGRGKQEALAALRSLMASSGITDADMRLAVSSQGYVTIQMPLDDYREDLLRYLAANFDAVRGVVEEQRAQIPIA